MAPFYFWFLGGIVLLILEMFIPGLVIIFFGFGAILTGVLTAVFNLPIAWEIVIFVISSVAFLMLFRKYFMNRFDNEKAEEELSDKVGQFAEVLEDIRPGRIGTVLFQQVPWKAKSDRIIGKGETVKITGTDNITLIVEPIKDDKE